MPICHRRHRLRATVAAVLALAATQAQATTEAAASNAGDLETVTVYAKRLMPVARVAATVTVIEQERIASTLANDIRDVVRYEPGVNVRNDPFRFGLDTISIRGLGGNRVAVEVDGIPAASGFAVGSYADSGRAFLDPAFTRRVELLRGPASSLYGSSAIGGIVALSTLTPADVLEAGRGSGFRVATGWDGSDDAWNASVLSAFDAGSAGRWLVGYVRRSGHETDTAANVEPDPSDWTSDAALLKYEAPTMPGGPLTVTLEGGRFDQDTAVDAFLGVGRFAATTSLEGHDRLQRDRMSVEQALTGGTGWFDSANWRVYRQRTATDQDTHEIRKAVPPRTPAVQLDRTFDFDEDTLGAEFSAVRLFDGGRGPAHDLVYGLEASLSQLTEVRNGLQTTLATGATTNVILGETLPVRDLPLSDVIAAGAYVQDEIRPVAGRWTLVPALRLDYYDLAPTVDAIYREDNTSSQPVGLHSTSVAPKLGATWRFTESVGGFFQYARGFRSPPPEDVNIGLEIPLFHVRAVPNPGLQPESSDGFELGLRSTNEALAWTTSVFDTEYRDFIESKVNIGLDAATGTTLFQSQNIARARIYGAEVSGRWHMGSRWTQLDGWSATFAATYLRGENLAAHEPLNSVDPPRAVLGLRYDDTAQRWGAELVVNATAPVRHVDDSQADLYRPDGYATVDLYGNVRLAQRWRLDVRLCNLTNEAYIEWADVRGRTSVDPLVPYYTQPGFNGSVALRWQF